MSPVPLTQPATEPPSLRLLRACWPLQPVDAAGLRFEVIRTAGRGTPVVWLHGAMGSAEIFYRQFLAWGHARQHVALTLPAIPHTQELAHAAMRCVDALGIGRFALVGTSLGGHVAQWIGADHPGRVERVVIGNTFRDPSPLQSAQRREAVEASSDDQFARIVLERIHASDDNEVRQVQLDLLGRPGAARAVRSRMLAVQRATIAPTMKLAASDILLVECDDDPLMPPEVRHDVRQAYAQSRVIGIAAGGHYPYVLQPDAYNQGVGDFLSA